MTAESVRSYMAHSGTESISCHEFVGTQHKWSYISAFEHALGTEASRAMNSFFSFSNFAASYEGATHQHQ